MAMVPSALWRLILNCYGFLPDPSNVDQGHVFAPNADQKHPRVMVRNAAPLRAVIWVHLGACQREHATLVTCQVSASTLKIQSKVLAKETSRGLLHLPLQVQDGHCHGFHAGGMPSGRQILLKRSIFQHLLQSHSGGMPSERPYR